jgi:hypothetical protein
MQVINIHCIFYAYIRKTVRPEKSQTLAPTVEDVSKVPAGVSQKPHPVVIAKAKPETIR